MQHCHMQHRMCKNHLIGSLLHQAFPCCLSNYWTRYITWEYMHLMGLLASTNSHDTSILEPSSPQFFLFPGCVFVRHKKRQIANIIADWIQVFTVYVAAMSTNFSEATLDLLTYQLTIIKVLSLLACLWYTLLREQYLAITSEQIFTLGSSWVELNSCRFATLWQ